MKRGRRPAARATSLVSRGGVRLGALVALSLAAACAHAPPPGARPTPTGAPPASNAPVRPTAAPPAAAPYKPCRTRTCVGGDPRRRQYFDERRRRYYFFDPVRKRYYWEDGTPRA